MAVEAFVPSANQSIKTGIEKIRVKVLETLNYDFLNFGIGSEMATCLVLLLQSEEMKITWGEVWITGRVFQYLCSGLTRQFCIIERKSCFHTYFRNNTLSQ
ncbi:hypothetical protein AVEN_15602-1 [Araneus ventricosus]|uniref:Uncharacterized protein n=1 Tax=Araneus ventricosus TaxID=182803 RepID=A0A4Y2QLQ7_ARAVE|nr:hypothetical protein AVEN_15602-1 [Araneus ventricosus]